MASPQQAILFAVDNIGSTFTSLTSIEGGSTTVTGGVTITLSASTGGAKSADSKSSGKYYFEVVHTTIGNASTGSGIISSTASASAIAGSTVDTVSIYKSGNIWIDGSNSGTTLGSFTNGQLLCWAVDLDNSKVYIRVGSGGNWNANGSANPATNTGGLSISGVPTPRPGGYLNVSTDAMTFNFGASAFTGTVPSGFTAGWTR